MGRTWTPEQKLARSIKGKQYWREHPHPSLGKKHSADALAKMKKPKQKSPQGGNCSQCGRAIYNHESVERGLGPTCAGLVPHKHES